MGWGTETSNELEKRRVEQSTIDKAMEARPASFVQRDAKYLDPVVSKRWEDFQLSKGYDEGSCDLSLVEEFYFGRRFHWLPQGTGSCTVSNFFRCHFRRTLWEVLLKGQLESLLGSTEYGPQSAAFYAPVTYGIARQIGGLRNGDGGFCGSTIQSAMLGVLRCDNGKLNELLAKLNANGDTDYPEPRSNSVYREFQSWKYNDAFKPFLTDPLAESVKISNVSTLVQNLEQYKPGYMCSMVAIKKGGAHKGLTYYIVDRNNQWAHAMCFCGMIKWQGRTFLLLSNESWQDNLIYPVPLFDNLALFSFSSRHICFC